MIFFHRSDGHLCLRVRSWLEMETEAPGSEGGERGDWTQSHVKGQRAASPQGAGSTHKGPGGGGAGWGLE